MDDELELEIHHTSTVPGLEEVIGHLVAENLSHAQPEEWQPLAALVRHPAHGVVGGAKGYTHWQWLFVSHLWLAPEWRGQGRGRALLAAMEQAAYERGCRNAHLDTFSFQSMPFYVRCGYTVFGELADYPPGHTRYFLHRRLDASAAVSCGDTVESPEKT